MKIFSLFKNTFSRGSGTLIMGTFMIVGIFAFILMFMEIYQMRENYINEKNATDTIADGTAIYAMENYDVTYNDITDKANQISSVINDEINVNVGDVDISKDDFQDDNIVTANTDHSYRYLTNLFSTQPYSLSLTSGTKYNYVNFIGLQYGLPAEALSDPVVRKMFEIAESQLGIPYVWDTMMPNVSFDCSGFVSYVINETAKEVDGVNWSVGRGTTGSLVSYCTIIPKEEARPGDLVFFKNTYHSSYIYGVSHVGIYAGNDMMIHCGHPVQYASFNTAYWNQHFLCFGRLPAVNVSE